MSILKLQDKNILEFDLDKGLFSVINESLLPISLRNAIVNTTDNANYRNFIKNYQYLQNFFRNRYLSIKRENAKKILNALHISQSNDDDTLIKTMIMCKALSITDDYWLTNNPNEEWQDVNLRTNPLHETIAQIALYGNSPLTITGKIHTPELTGQGAYAKAWKRENDILYLYKAGTKNGNETDIEASVSKILDYTNAPHIQYELFRQNGKKLTKCRNMCNDNYSIVTANDVFAWCNRTGSNFIKYVINKDSENFYKTIVVDYLISNSDRHGQNWGFYVNNKTGEIENMHPLFDHNNAFDEDEIKLKDGGESLMIVGISKRDAAKYAIKKCNFRILPTIPKNIFLSESHYESFIHRANDLDLNLNTYYNFNNFKSKEDYYNSDNMISFLIKSKNFLEAYQLFKNIIYISNESTDIHFMKEVVKEHGTDAQTLNNAVEAVTDFKNESPAFMAKLLNDTLKTDEYQKAFEAGQGKTKERENVK